MSMSPRDYNRRLARIIGVGSAAGCVTYVALARMALLAPWSHDLIAGGAISSIGGTLLYSAMRR